MKVLNYSSINFWNELDNHLSLREVETSSKIDANVKSIIADVKKYLFHLDKVGLDYHNIPYLPSSC